MASVLERLESRTRKSQEVFKRTREVVAQEVVGTVDMPYPLYIKEAKGSRITDVDGNEYIDMTMGFGPHILGHAPDVVVEAVTEAVARGLQFGLHNPYQEPLAALMVEAGALRRQGRLHQLRHRGHHVRRSGREVLHGQEQDRDVRRRLSRGA